MGDRLSALLQDLHDEHEATQGLVAQADLDLPTPAEPWNVRDTVAHLAGFDEEATRAATTPQLFLAGLEEVAADIDGFMAAMSQARRHLSREELTAQWRAGHEAMLAAFRDLDPAVRVPWYGPPMSLTSFATARLMEYWAHGQDVADAAGLRHEPTERLRHVCHLGVRTRGFSFTVRGRQAPEAEVHVVLDAPGGGTWEFGDPGASERVAGPAEDFCLLVTQRRHRFDTALVATGAGADAWLDVAQCFAGPPSTGRAPLAAR